MDNPFAPTSLQDSSSCATPKKSSEKRSSAGGILATAKKRSDRTHYREDPGFFACVFTIPKKTRGLRLIIELNVMDSYIRYPSFKQENNVRFREQLRIREWKTSDAQLHLPIHPQFLKYMHMHIEGRARQFKSMCIGLTMVQPIFTKILQPVVIWTNSIPKSSLLGHGHRLTNRQL